MGRAPYHWYVIAIAVLLGVVDTVTAAYAVSLNWTFETGLVMSSVLDVVGGVGATGAGGIVIPAFVTAKVVTSVAVVVLLIAARDWVVSVPGWRALMLVPVAIAAYGPLTNLAFILGMWGVLP